MTESTIDVLVTVPFNDEQIAAIKAASPRLNVQQYGSELSAVPDEEWAQAEILYSYGGRLPSPDRVPNLRWVQLHSAGADGILDHPLMQKGGVMITTTSGIHATPIAEYCLAVMLAHSQRLPDYGDAQKQKDWGAKKSTREKAHELRGRTLGVVGYGSIGREAARLANAFGMKILATKRDVRRPQDEGFRPDDLGEKDGDPVDRLYPPEALHTMLAECDYVIVAVPLTSETEGMIDAEALAAMKPGAYIINIARGKIIDEAALIEALESGHLGGAGLDVFEQEPLPQSSPLWEMDNVIVTPHVSGYTPGNYDRRACELFIENLHRYMEGRELYNVVSVEHGY